MPATLAAGNKAPKFRLAGTGGNTYSLADFAGKRLVLYFYPKADTPGCTTESNDFSALAAAFAKVNTTVLGVSADSVKKIDAFKAKHSLAIPLASDESHAMLEAYGACGEKSLYGRSYVGVIRSTVLIDRDGTIVRTWPKVKVAGHAEEVLAAVRAL
jgi:peroxiredoxin Q/BCP